MEITGISPPRGREGDTIIISGTGFIASPMADNLVRIDGAAATVTAATSTEITATVPALTNLDGWVAVIVQPDGGDLDEGSGYPWWAKASLDDIRTGDIPGQVPGPGEDPDVTQADVQEAKDYERAAEILYHFIRVLLTTRGDIFARGATEVERLGVGGPEQALEAQPAADQGLAWSRPPTVLTLGWARQVQSGETTSLALVANGDASQTSTAIGEHGCPVDGEVDALWVLVEEEAGADTLDQVILNVNGVAAYTSSSGLGLTNGQSHRVTGLSIDVERGDVLVLLTTKAGSAATMRITAGVRIAASLAEIADTIAMTDEVDADATLGVVGPSDTVDVTDALDGTTESASEWGDDSGGGWGG